MVLANPVISNWPLERNAGTDQIASEAISWRRPKIRKKMTCPAFPPNLFTNVDIRLISCFHFLGPLLVSGHPKRPFFKSLKHGNT